MSKDNPFFTRREFIASAAAGAAVATLPSFGAPQSKGAKSSYFVSVLGDTHYDTEPESVYHSKYDYNNRWAKVVKEQNLPWTNVCDSRGVASTYVALYNISKLPAAYVIGADGLAATSFSDAASLSKVVRAALAKK